MSETTNTALYHHPLNCMYRLQLREIFVAHKKSLRQWLIYLQHFSWHDFDMDYIFTITRSIFQIPCISPLWNVEHFSCPEDFLPKTCCKKCSVISFWLQLRHVQNILYKDYLFFILRWIRIVKVSFPCWKHSKIIGRFTTFHVSTRRTKKRTIFE